MGIDERFYIPVFFIINAGFRHCAKCFSLLYEY